MAVEQIKQLEIADFSGGLNVRDSQVELADNETPDCINVTLDETGGLMKRLGTRKLNVSALAGPVIGVYYWASGQEIIVQVGATLYKTTDYVTFTAFATLSTSDPVAFTDFTSKLVAVHKVDGVFTYDDATWALKTAAVKGTCVATWQNKVFVGGDTSNKPRVWWCNAGDVATWTIATDWIDVRDKDDGSITALGAGQGQDYQGRPGLLVFKSDSAYRINNATTGAYTTLSTFAGASGPNAVATLDGQTLTFCQNGIFKTDGVSPLVRISDKVGPMFDPTQMNFSKLAGVCAGTYRDRVVFSFPWGSSQATNNRTLEVSPSNGWIVPHTIGAAAFTVFAKNNRKLYGGSPTSGYLFECFSSWTDLGVFYTARYQTRWISPEGAALCSFIRARFQARGAFDTYLKIDYETDVGELYGLSILGDGFVWNDPLNAIWNQSTMIWGPTSYENYADIYPGVSGKAISFVFYNSQTTSAQGTSLLGDGVAPDVGTFAVYRITVDYVRLGLA